VCLTGLAATVHPEQEPLRVVPKLDYERYSGTWFEVARLPFRYQKDCASDDTAPNGPAGV
jgi:apolipoprotein D and lipocalin family protein